jgi:hypothetical protein
MTRCPISPPILERADRSLFPGQEPLEGDHREIAIVYGKEQSDAEGGHMRTPEYDEHTLRGLLNVILRSYPGLVVGRHNTESRTFNILAAPERKRIIPEALTTIPDSWLEDGRINEIRDLLDDAALEGRTRAEAQAGAV